MRVSIFLHLLRFSLLILGITIHLSGETISDSSFLESSKFWPEKIIVNIQLTGVTHGNVVKPGGEWTFLRYRDGKCLVDLGHNGVHVLNVEDTDIVERVTKISKERTFPFQGLFTYRYTKSFYDPNTLHGFQLGDMDSYDYFVLFYIDYENTSNASKLLGQFIQDYLYQLRDEIKVEVLLLPSYHLIAENELKDCISDGLAIPVVIPFLREGVMHTLKHDHKLKGDVVLIDKFGKILKQFFLFESESSKEIYDQIRGSL